MSSKCSYKLNSDAIDDFFVKAKYRLLFLFCKNCQRTKIIDANHLSQKKTLNLSHLGLTKIPRQINRLVHLEELNLSHNQIEQIDNLSELNKLKILNLNSNSIPKITGLEYLTNVEQIFEERSDWLCVGKNHSRSIQSKLISNTNSSK